MGIPVDIISAMSVFLQVVFYVLFYTFLGIPTFIWQYNRSRNRGFSIEVSLVFALVAGVTVWVAWIAWWWNDRNLR